VDGPETSTVASRHILIKGFHCIRASKLAELLVHVVCARARVIAKPYSKVLHLQRLLFVNLTKKKKKNNRRARRAQRGQSRCDVVSIPVRLPLEGCMGQRGIGTDNVHSNDLSIGLLDLL
jgi:hypothetical protein